MNKLKENLVYIILIGSLIVNAVLIYDNIIYRDALDKSLDAHYKSWDALNETMVNIHIMQNYIDEQKQAIDELAILNIAYQMYMISGNESWLPNSIDEIKNVSKI